MHKLQHRRRFLQTLGQTAIFLPVSAMASSDPFVQSMLTSRSAEQPTSVSADKKLGIALVGLGKYSEEELAPALTETQWCKLTAIVTGTPSKVKKWTDKYQIPQKNVYNYENFDSIAKNPDVDIVYIVLPNSMHAEYTIRAAKAGKHVICEKPMATSVADCEAMIKACKDAGKMLSIGYRLHFEPHNMSIAEFGKKKTYGKIKKITAIDSQKMEAGVWRLDKKLAGGGPVMDLGVYCVQAAIYAAGENPVSVTAKAGKKTDMERFATVEQSMDFQLDFPSGAIANCRTSYDESGNLLRVDAAEGWYELQPAYPYKGIKGKTSMGAMNLKDINQQAAQMDDFAHCVSTGKKTRVPGEMGLRDVKVLMAIYESAKTGKKVSLKLS
jgi:predicted dehydrogenase